MIWRSFFILFYLIFVSNYEAKNHLIASEKSILIQAILRECPVNFKSIRFAVINDHHPDSKNLYKKLKTSQKIQSKGHSVDLEFHYLTQDHILKRRPSFDFVFSSSQNEDLYKSYKVISDKRAHLKKGAFIVIFKRAATPEVILNLDISRKYDITFPTSFMRFVKIYKKEDES
ncbi:hypothetical protein MJH12_12590 [bacterium]|nr:hypothetical protein [bacterium]